MCFTLLQLACQQISLFGDLRSSKSETGQPLQPCSLTGTHLLQLPRESSYLGLSSLQLLLYMSLLLQLALQGENITAQLLHLGRLFLCVILADLQTRCHWVTAAVGLATLADCTTAVYLAVGLAAAQL